MSWIDDLVILGAQNELLQPLNNKIGNIIVGHVQTLELQIPSKKNSQKTELSR